MRRTVEQSRPRHLPRPWPELPSLLLAGVLFAAACHLWPGWWPAELAVLGVACVGVVRGAEGDET
jgi:hypothetical protein